MSYLSKPSSPNGVLYVGVVKWSNDYKNIMLFKNKTKRNEFMTTNLTLLKNNVIFYSPNNYIDIRGKIKNVENLNYCYFVNDSDISNTPYFCFITNYEYVAPRTTRLYIELDVVQMYLYDVTFYQSYIERAIIKKSDDVVGANTLPEPISANVDHFNEINAAEGDLEADDYSPRWVLHMSSRYNEDTGEYEYSGNGSNNTFGEYGAYITGRSDIDDLLEMYGREDLGTALEQLKTNVNANNGKWTQAGKNFVNNIAAALLTGDFTQIQDYNESIGLTALSSGLSLAQFQDHRDELIGLYAVPKWVIDNYGTGGDLKNLDNRSVETSLHYSISNTIIDSDGSNQYQPRNKKLLTSICRAFVLANKNGVKIPFKPELFTSTRVVFTLRAIAMATNGYQYYTDNYEDITVGHGEIVYNSERRVGYDANTGLNKTLNAISAGQSLLNTGMGAAAGIAGAPGAASKALAIGNAVGNIAQAGISAIDQIGAQEEHFGSNGDLLRTRGKFAMLHFYEVFPKKDQMQAIDNYFDMYGYTIAKHYNPMKYIFYWDEQQQKYDREKPLRTQWNYIKTNDINIRLNAPSDYENAIKSIFNAGVTIWHKYDDFGDYSKDNDDTQ